MEQRDYYKKLLWTKYEMTSKGSKSGTFVSLAGGTGLGGCGSFTMVSLAGRSKSWGLGSEV